MAKNRWGKKLHFYWCRDERLTGRGKGRVWNTTGFQHVHSQPLLTPEIKKALLATETKLMQPLFFVVMFVLNLFWDLAETIL